MRAMFYVVYMCTVSAQKRMRARIYARYTCFTYVRCACSPRAQRAQKKKMRARIYAAATY